VVIAPKKTPLQNYPYINSFFVLKTGRIDLSRVDIYNLIKHNRLQVSTIEIEKPEIFMQLKEKIISYSRLRRGIKLRKEEIEQLKRYLDTYFLKEFILNDASMTIEDGYAGNNYNKLVR